MKKSRAVGSWSALTELKGLKKTLAKAAQQVWIQAQEARHVAAAAAEEDEKKLFVLSVGKVTLMQPPQSSPHWHTLPRPLPVPRQRMQDEAAALTDALSDGFDVESLLETDTTLSFRRPGVGPEVTRKLRRGVWVIQAQLDLHGLRSDEARTQLAAFLREASRQGLRCLRVIHGKGHGSPGRQPVLKSKVKSWLVQKDGVMAFAQARACDGGHGALLVLLRPGVRC
jgi:DNA-nicking Smr family endonuclease